MKFLQLQCEIYSLDNWLDVQSFGLLLNVKSFFFFFWEWAINMSFLSSHSKKVLRINFFEETEWSTCYVYVTLFLFLLLFLPFSYIVVVFLIIFVVYCYTEPSFGCCNSQISPIAGLIKECLVLSLYVLVNDNEWHQQIIGKCCIYRLSTNSIWSSSTQQLFLI